MDVAVVGSLHLDIMVAAPRLPLRDETLIGNHWHYKCGGKGGNQAVAAAQFGGLTAFGGQTGIDDFGKRLRSNLLKAGVDIACVDYERDQASGMSVAITEAQGEYGAVVVSGANLAISPTKIVTAWKKLWQAKILLLQNEIPEDVNIAAAKQVKLAGGKVMLNAAPARQMSKDLLDLVDILVVNRIEAAMLSEEEQPALALSKLADLGKHVILTRGSEGLMAQMADGRRFDIAALPIHMISSHGAGDCFCGALAARLAGGEEFERACHFANAAAGLVVSTSEAERDTLSVADVEGALTY